MIYEIHDEVLEKYLTSEDDDFRDLAETTQKVFTEYIQIVMNFQTKIEDLKKTMDTADFQSAYSDLDKSRSAKHNSCLSQIDIMNRISDLDNLKFCELPEGKTSKDVNRTDLGQSIMKWYYDRGNALTNDMLIDLGIDENKKRVTDQIDTNNISNGLKTQNNVKLDLESSKKKNLNKKSISPFNAKLGDIVYTRCREKEFLDEKYDILNSNQDYGYANSKMRPMMILGKNNGNIVLAQIRSYEDSKEWSPIKNSRFALDSTQLNSKDFDEFENLVIGTVELRQVPEDQFHFDRKLGRISSKELQGYLNTYLEYKHSSNESPNKNQDQFDSDSPIGVQWLKELKVTDLIKSVPTSECKRIHTNDLIKVQREKNINFIKSRNELNKSSKDLTVEKINNKVSNLVKLKQNLIKGQDEINKTLGISKLDYIEHMSSRKNDYFNKSAEFRQEQLEDLENSSKDQPSVKITININNYKNNPNVKNDKSKGDQYEL